MSLSLACGWFTVTSPSAQAAPRRAVSTLTAGAISGGLISGTSQILACRTVTRPSRVTSLPSWSSRMICTDSSRRCCRVALSGQASPVTCSFMYSPLPGASQNRPGNMSASVAEACAMMAGW